MRNEHFVNAHARSLRAAGRTGSTDWMQEAEQSVEPETEQEVVGLGDILRGEFELTTRTQSGSPAVIRGSSFNPRGAGHSSPGISWRAGFWLVSSITEIKVSQTAIQQNQREARTIYSGNLRLMTAYATNETNRVQFMVGLLTPSQQKTVFEFDKANPRPPLPNVDDTDEKEN